MLKATILDSFKRLIEPSIDREIRSDLTEKAEEKSNKSIWTKLKTTITRSTNKRKNSNGFDPAYRTGCKIAVIDETGKVLDYTTVYPTEPQNDVEGAKKRTIKTNRKRQNRHDSNRKRNSIKRIRNVCIRHDKKKHQEKYTM